VLSWDIQSGKFWLLASTGAKKNGTGSKSSPCCATGLDIDGLGIIEGETEVAGVLGEVSEILGEAPGVLLPDEQELSRAAARTSVAIRKVVIRKIIEYVSQKQPDLHWN
jgi:hypothetical protein